MIFGPEMLEKVLSGEKTVTRRRSSRYVVGREYAVQPGRGQFHVAHVRVLSVRTGPMGEVGGEEAQREGFTSWGGFINYWEKMYGSIDFSETVARIEFELAPSCPKCS